MAVISKKPIKKGPGLPPILGGTPNPLAGVSPNPAGNRNSAFPKTGAVLPFPNPNQPLADLAAPPGGAPPAAPSVVGGVTAGLAGGLPPVITGGQDKGSVSVQAGQERSPVYDEEGNIKGYMVKGPQGWTFEPDPNYKSGETTVTPPSETPPTTPPVTPPAAPPAEPPPVQPAAPPAGAPPKEEEVDPDIAELVSRMRPSRKGDVFQESDISILVQQYMGRHRDANRTEVTAKIRAFIAQFDVAKQKTADLMALQETLKKMFPSELLKGQNPGQVLAALTPESIDSAHDTGKISADEYLKLQANWQRLHPGEEYPVSKEGTPSGELQKQKDIIQGRVATTAVPASGATPEQLATYREAIKGFSKVPTTREEAVAWLQQSLTPPPGFRQDPTTGEWLDAQDNPAEGDALTALQEYEFQKSQYAENRKRADAIVASYADLDAAQRGRDAADANLQKALGTKDVMEQVELTYLLEKADLDLKDAQKKNQMVQTFVALTNNPAMAARLKALGLLDQFNKDIGMDLKVPDRVPKEKVFAMIPSLGDWSKMNPQQQMDALEMLSAKTGWMPEELAALMSETAGAPGGGRGGGVSESTTKRQ